MSKEINSAEVYTLFEDIRKDINSIPNKTASAINTDEVKQMTDKLNEVVETVRQPVKQKLTIDFRGNAMSITIVVMVCLLVVFGIIVSKQTHTIGRLEDNDLKYRYVKMYGGINADEIYDLEALFKQGGDSIKVIRKQVERYEELVREQAEKIEQARLNEIRAQQLEQEVQNVKGSK